WRSSRTDPSLGTPARGGVCCAWRSRPPASGSERADRVELEGKAALITGGTTGIGFAIAQAFLREGARVVITGRDGDLGEQAEKHLRVHGDARFLAADASDPGQVTGSVEKAVRLLGGVEVLVNNAGIGVQATAMETPLEDFDRVMGVNVRGAFMYAQ